MSDTSAGTKAPPDTTSQLPDPAVTVVDGPDGQSLPIEITLNQSADEPGSSPAARGPRGALRVLPLALFGTEAASTGASALYAAAGTAGVLTAAGVAVGGGLVAAGVAAHRARKSQNRGAGGRVLRSAGHRSTLGSTGTGTGRTNGRSGGRGPGLGSAGRGGRSGGRGHSSALGAAGSGAAARRTHPRNSPTSRNGASMNKPFTSGNTPSMGRGSSGRGPVPGQSGGGSGSSGRGAAGGRGGILRRLSQRRVGTGPVGTGAAGGPLGKGQDPNRAEPRAGGPGRSTVRAWARRAARSGMRGAALARRLGRQVAESPAGQALRERIRSVRRALAKKGRAGVRYVLRSAVAKVAAGAVGALVLIPGLVLRAVAAAGGGVLRFLHLAPRNGTRWGVRFTRWSKLAATAVHKPLMLRAKDDWTKATGPDVLTDFDEPGHVRPHAADDGFGTDHFGGNLVSVFKQETEAVRDAYATYDPPMMLAVAVEYWGLPEGVGPVAEAVRQLAVNTADKYPADAVMADLVAQVYSLLHQAIQKAQEVGPLFATAHEADLRRYEEPRPGEHMWNIAEHRQDGGYDCRFSHLVTAARDIAHVYSRYEPGHMNQVAAEYEGIPDGIENIAAAINLLQVRSNDRYPVDKAVVDALADLHQVLMAAASAAQELMPAFRRLHASDIARHEAPRNGEESEAMWDV